MKIVINCDFGGFGLSNKGFELFLQKKGIEYEMVDAHYPIRGDIHDYYAKGHVGNDKHYLSYHSMCDDRTDPALVAVVEELGRESFGWASNLKIIDIPDDVQWQLEEYDGREWIAEKHRTWR